MTDDPAAANSSESSVDPNSIEGVFIAALSRDAGQAREEFLKESCPDAERLNRVRALLMAYEDSGSFLQQPAAHLNPLDSFSQYMVPSDKPEVIGELGDYEILETIGRGGMGVVFKAFDKALNRIVAIKVLAPELSSNPNSRRRFLREAQSVASVIHPHIVSIHAVSDDKLPYFVMECIVGQSLQQKLDKSAALEPQEVLRIGQQISEGIAAAHRQGIVHRDIKPANILLENGVERVRLTDFGLARARDDESITMTGEVSGTPMYMSPEQAKGETVDFRSDLFSLGAVLYAMCTGHSPFRGSNMAAVVKNVCDREPRAVSEFNSELPEWLDRLIGSLLSKNPDERPVTAEAVGEALRLGLAGQSPVVAVAAASSGVASASNAIAAAAATTGLLGHSSKTELTLEDAVHEQTRQLKCLAILSVVVSLTMLMLSRGNPPLFASRLGLNPVWIWGLFGSIALVNVLLWCSLHMNGFQNGVGAWRQGIVASFMALLAFPSFIISFPIGLATLGLLKRPGVKDAFRLAGEGDMSGLQQSVAKPRAGWLIGLLGVGMTLMTCVWLYSPGGAPEIGPAVVTAAVYVTALIGLLGVLAYPLLSQFRLRDHGSAFLKRPAVAVVLLAIATALLALPSFPWVGRQDVVGVPQNAVWASSSKLSTVAVAANPMVNQHALDAVNAIESARLKLDMLDQVDRGGVILDVDPGLEIELHRDGFVWRLSSKGLITPHDMRRNNEVGVRDFGMGMSDGAMSWDGFDDGGYGGGAGMPASGIEESHPAVHELPKGKYTVVVFDRMVGWQRYDTELDAADVALDRDSGPSAILKRRGQTYPLGDRNYSLLAASADGNLDSSRGDIRAAYLAEPITVTGGANRSLRIARNFSKLGAIEPNWESLGLLSFKWGSQVWLLDKPQAQCVQQLLAATGTADSSGPRTEVFVSEDKLVAGCTTDAETLAGIFNDGKHPAFDGLFSHASGPVSAAGDGEDSYALRRLLSAKATTVPSDEGVGIRSEEAAEDTQSDDEKTDEEVSGDDSF